MTRLLWAAVVGCLLGLSAQETPKPANPAAAKPKEPSEPGIPVTDSVVIAKCSPCHQKDDKGNLTRISWERTTPEGWQQVIKRMVRLNNLQLTPGEARQIVRALSTTHGLAPEEAKLSAYYWEQRRQDEEFPNETVRTTCASCHPFAVPKSWRRSKEEWDLLVNMHVGYFPVAEFTAFRRPPRAPNAPPPPPGQDQRDPVEQAIDTISKAYPLHTTEWSNWKASMRAPRLQGRWLLNGYQPGRGPVVGEVRIEPAGTPDEFNTILDYTYTRDGAKHQRAGKAIVYTGYAWRGRTMREPADTTGPEQIREVMAISRDQATIEGRWFWGGYNELEINAKLTRITGSPAISHVSSTRLRAGSTGNGIDIYGTAFPADIQPRDIDLGAGLTVTQVRLQNSGRLTVTLDVAKDAPIGRRDLFVRQVLFPSAIAVYDTVDYIKVTPETGLARLGGTSHPKGLQQFEAIGMNRGADGKPKTADDIDLGPLTNVQWSLEEFIAVYGDDDIQFVGTLNDNGLFTPAGEGPNPKRKFSRNNYGDVWIVATYRGTDAAETKDRKPLSGRAYLISTVPLYIRWDQPEVAQ